MIADYLAWLARRRKSEKTIATYRAQLEAYEAYLEVEGVSVSDATYQTVEEFGYSPTTHGQEPAASTVKVRLAAVKGYHEWLLAHGHDAHSVRLAAAPKRPHRNPKPIPDDVWTALWRSPMADEARLFLGLGYFCGLRPAEIVTLRPCDVYPERRLMLVVGKGDKERQVDYGMAIDILSIELPHLCEDADVWEKILAVQADRRAAIGANQVWWDAEDDPTRDVGRLRWHLRRILTDAELDPATFTPHTPRHSCATNLLRAGLEPHEIQDYLGHDSYETTRQYVSTAGVLARALERKKG